LGRASKRVPGRSAESAARSPSKSSAEKSLWIGFPRISAASGRLPIGLVWSLSHSGGRLHLAARLYREIKTIETRTAQIQGYHAHRGIPWPST
jgi:hypothetical protein